MTRNKMKIKKIKRMMKMHTRGHGRCHEFHHGSVRAEGSSSSWKPWMPEIEFNPQNPGYWKKERTLSCCCWWQKRKMMKH